MRDDENGLASVTTPNSAGEIIASGGAIQQIKTTYATAVAVQNPRNLKVVQEKCLIEAELAGDLCYYQWSAGGSDVVEGGTIKGAMIAVRNFGNVVVEQKPVQETRTSYIFTTAVIDLETGFTLERQFRQSKNWTVYGRHDEFRKEDIRFQIGQSKSARNAILNFLPSYITDRMIEVAKKSVRIKIDAKIKEAGGNIDVVIEQILVVYKRFGIEEDFIVAKHNTPRKVWDAAFLTGLSGELKALEVRDETPLTLYREYLEKDDNVDRTTGEVKDPSLGDPGAVNGDPKDRRDYRGDDDPNAPTLEEQKVIMLTEQLEAEKAKDKPSASTVKKLERQLTDALKVINEKK